VADRVDAVALPKNSIRQFYRPTGHTSDWVTTEKMAAKKPGIPPKSGGFTVARIPVAANHPGKRSFTGLGNPLS
jgi:hypothetical protein